MKHWLGTVVFAAMAIVATAHAPAVKAESADDRFKAIYTQEWTWRREQFPGLDSEDREASAHDDRLPAVDAKTQALRLKYWTDVLHRLDGIATADLSADNQVNLAVYRPQIENLAAEIRFRLYEMPFNSDSQFWSDLGFMANRPFKNARDASNYIARLNDVPRYFDEQIVNMEVTKLSTQRPSAKSLEPPFVCRVGPSKQ